jgi:glutamate decarboxylase
MEKNNYTLLDKAAGAELSQGALSVTPVYGRPEFSGSLDLQEAKIPEQPTAADTVYQMVKNELMIDHKPGMNLATFCNESYTDPWGAKTVEDSIMKNFIDGTEYTGTTTAALRCMYMIGNELGTKFKESDDLNANLAKHMYGTPTIGSSEAIMLGMIAHKFIWSQKHRVLLDNFDTLNIKVDPRDRPVVVMSAHVHSCWDKFCLYYGAVALYIPIAGPPYAIDDGSRIKDVLNLKIEDPDSMFSAKIRSAMGYTEHQGDRTIGDLVMCVGAVVGSTFTGSQDDVPSIDNNVDEYCKQHNKEYSFEQKQLFNTKYEEWYKSGHEGESPNRIPSLVDIPIHVDAASGFVFMFASNGAEVKFNFKDCPKRVASINLSNHKFGMTFTGMGSILFKDANVVDHSLVYNITYLGGTFNDYTVNFSRGSAIIMMQYYNFLRFGRAGYRAILDNCIKNTEWLIDQLNASVKLSKYFKNISNNYNGDGKQPIHMPLVALTWADSIEHSKPPWDIHTFAHMLDMHGWSVPSYHIPITHPENTEGIEMLRIVVQQAITRSKLQVLLKNMEEIIDDLEDYGKLVLAQHRDYVRRKSTP